MIHSSFDDTSQINVDTGLGLLNANVDHFLCNAPMQQYRENISAKKPQIGVETLILHASISTCLPWTPSSGKAISQTDKGSPRELTDLELQSNWINMETTNCTKQFIRFETANQCLMTSNEGLSLLYNKKYYINRHKRENIPRCVICFHVQYIGQSTSNNHIK